MGDYSLHLELINNVNQKINSSLYFINFQLIKYNFLKFPHP